MQLLIFVLIAIVVFAILAFGMKWVCDTFFPTFRPAYWICGVILLIVLLVTVNSVFSGGAYVGAPLFGIPWHR
jgi:hypothetical protein